MQKSSLHAVAMTINLKIVYYVLSAHVQFLQVDKQSTSTQTKTPLRKIPVLYLMCCQVEKANQEMRGTAAVVQLRSLKNTKIQMQRGAPIHL